MSISLRFVVGSEKESRVNSNSSNKHLHLRERVGCIRSLKRKQRKQEHKEFNNLMASNTAAKEPLMSVTFHIFCVLLVPGALASWSSSRSLHAFGSLAFYHL